MSKTKWYKGNIHTHTTESDGDSDPRSVVRWYRSHGYDFLVLSDHNHRTILDHGTGKRRFRKPLMIPGEEVTASAQNIPIHINGIGISRVVEAINKKDIVSTLQANVNAILKAGGIASINHPNFRWAFDHEHIKQVDGATLLEIFNGHPGSNVYGGPGKFSYDQIWDNVLSSGKNIFGVATDDSHNYHDFNFQKSNPGRGWVVVRSSELSSQSIIQSLSTGDFYSSTGITLTDLSISKERIYLKIEQHDSKPIYTTTFTGSNGSKLAVETGLEASYLIRGDEGYIRAVVDCSSGAKAWIQPLFI